MTSKMTPEITPEKFLNKQVSKWSKFWAPEVPGLHQNTAVQIEALRELCKESAKNIAFSHERFVEASRKYRKRT